MSERSQQIKGPHPATVGLIFLAVASVTILLLSFYYHFFNKMRKQTRLEQRVAKREQEFDRGSVEEDLEMQEVPLDDLKVPPKPATRN
ncbi:hypothetical protein VE03_07454 [Pseudogymnoascus sp. 23342-1-I1]|nr:hypothetical protein VE03_07454 [Pseudogymnoascus sp. 23342-1-I1]